MAQRKKTTRVLKKAARPMSGWKEFPFRAIIFGALFFGTSLWLSAHPASFGQFVNVANISIRNPYYLTNGSLPDLDNCPGGPFSTPCFDTFGIQISCSNPSQADDNFNLLGNICDLCGNGTIEGGEQCDGSNLGGQTCITRGLTGGNLSCNQACGFDLSDCYGCGDGVLDVVTEKCDTAIPTGTPGSCPGSCDPGETLSGAGCQAECLAVTACINGDTACPTGCTAATDNDCPSVCGDGVVDANGPDNTVGTSDDEQCDNGAANGTPISGVYCDATCHSQIACEASFRADDWFKLYVNGKYQFGSGGATVSNSGFINLIPGENLIAFYAFDEWLSAYGITGDIDGNASGKVIRCNLPGFTRTISLDDQVGGAYTWSCISVPHPWQAIPCNAGEAGTCDNITDDIRYPVTVGAQSSELWVSDIFYNFAANDLAVNTLSPPIVGGTWMWTNNSMAANTCTDSKRKVGDMDGVVGSCGGAPTAADLGTGGIWCRYKLNVCVPDGSNGNCPAGCALVDDPDCGSGKPTACIDGDGDGYGVAPNNNIANGCTFDGNDCNDSIASMHPGGTEICGDSIDQDCNGSDLACAVVTYYRDADSDSYVSLASSGTCSGTGCQPAGSQLTPGTDCNDSDSNINPGQTDNSCDDIDQNCSGSADEGYAPTATSCGTGSCSATGQNICQSGALVNTCAPGAPSAEVCDSADNDCNGSVDDGITATPTSCGVGACSATGTQSCVGGELVNSCTPGTPTTEICDTLDNDCDGSTDEGCGTECTVGQTRSCATAPLNFVGVCSTQTADCVNGLWDRNDCQAGSGYQGSELTCNDNLDNDCDGVQDCSEAVCGGQIGPNGRYCCPSGNAATNCPAASGTCELATCAILGNECTYLQDATPNVCGSCGVCGDTGGAAGSRWYCQASTASNVCGGCGACQPAASDTFTCAANQAACDAAGSCTNCQLLSGLYECQQMDGIVDAGQCDDVTQTGSCVSSPCWCSSGICVDQPADIDKDGIVDDIDPCPYDKDNDLDGDFVCAVGCGVRTFASPTSWPGRPSYYPSSQIPAGTYQGGQLCNGSLAEAYDRCQGFADNGPDIFPAGGNGVPDACDDQVLSCRVLYGAYNYLDLYVDGRFLTGNNILFDPATGYSPANRNQILPNRWFATNSRFVNSSGPHVIAFEVRQTTGNASAYQINGIMADPLNWSQNAAYCSAIANRMGGPTTGAQIRYAATLPAKPQIPAKCFVAVNGAAGPSPQGSLKWYDIGYNDSSWELVGPPNDNGLYDQLRTNYLTSWTTGGNGNVPLGAWVAPRSFTNIHLYCRYQF